MSLLRIRGALGDPSLSCQWALIGDGGQYSFGEGSLAQLPARADRLQLLVPADQVLLLRTRLPRAARRHAGSVLAFAVEERTVGEPEANLVSWLGTAGSDDVLAVIDKAGLQRWRAALEALGLRMHELQCETLLLPREPGEWSLAWNGRDGFVRTGEFDGAATDCGDRDLPPTWLRLRLQQAQTEGVLPGAIALYPTTPDALPDVTAWARELGIAVRVAEAWDWRAAPAGAGVPLTQEKPGWRLWSGMAVRLRPAAIILAAALMIHLIALLAQWSSLHSEQRTLRQQMESRFRSVFPEAVAVADPELQMRRKLADARHVAGLSDEGDFLPMLQAVAASVKPLPAGSLRTLSYESGRMTIELSAVDAAGVRKARDRLLASGLTVDPLPSADSESRAALVLTVRAR